MTTLERSLYVENVTQPGSIVTQGRVADTFITRLRGLIGVRSLEEGEGLWIRPCSSIHCMFMSIPIDVIYLDKAERVVAIEGNVRPWRLGGFHRRVHSVVELPAGALASMQVAQGDQLSLRIG
jgi:uncharacterized membrane protein (UPF0127 family)